MVRLGPTDDAAAGQWQHGDRDILVVMDAGHDVLRLARVLRDLPVELVGRLRSDRVLRLPEPPRGDAAHLGEVRYVSAHAQLPGMCMRFT